MSPTPSPERDITELFSRPRITNIPSDQKDLLESPDSWAVELKNTPHGLSQIPGHVLETVKSTYLAKKEVIQERTPISKKRSGSPAPSARSKRIRNGPSGSPKSDHQNPQQSSPERHVSWSPSQSPPRHNQEKEPERMPSSIVHETPKPNFTAPPVRTLIPVVENPPSSAETEDDLETRIPDAQPHLNAPINRTAVRSNPIAPSPLSSNSAMATPPCAQPSNPTQAVVPNTVVGNKGSLLGNDSPRNGGSRPRLKFKPIPMDDDLGKKRKKSHNEKERLAPTIIPPVIVDSSIPTSSDPVIPFTGNVAATQESIVKSIEGNEEIETVDNVEEVVPSTSLQGLNVEPPTNHRPETVVKLEPFDPNKKTTNNGCEPTQRPTTPSHMGPSKMATSANSSKHLSSQMAAKKSPLPAPPHIAPGAPIEPYDAFVQQYPDYPNDDSSRKLPGTKLNFITACVYLNYLRPKRLLRDCLYDDFIRAFPCYYREYVDRAGMTAMVAIDWFNKQKDPPAYDKYLVNRGNLSHILRSYPEEFTQANEMVYKRAEGDVLSIYTSSEDEGDFEEHHDPSSSGSRPSHHSSNRRGVESPPIATVESDMDIDLPEMPAAPLSTSSRRKSSMASANGLEVTLKPVPAPKPTKPRPSSSKSRNMPSQTRPLQSSRAREILTQPPPPPSPKITQSSMLPPSTYETSAMKSRAPRPSQYFNKIAASNQSKSTPVRRSSKDLAKLREHFRKSRGSGSQDGRRSSSRA
ncbi:hypothetical protein F53441_9044 [Fusarium austroafricanum]|uniref:Uncharacterized protein n=1 Tax=Fusarium austroafricanum TaxID=2364996 RepID=A0A8H4KDP8_9HYPO|nr:hypothetical protein F53441_9044 [Fusarium austroafricanum]